MAKEQKKQGKKISMMAALILLALVPTLAAAAVVATLGCVELDQSLEEEVYDGLYVAALDLKVYYEYDITNRDDHLPEYEHDFVDHLKDKDIELTFFMGNERFITSIKDDSNPTGRNENTPAGEGIWERVSKGEVYEAKGVTINGEDYYVIYVPATDADGNIVGMAFAGKPEKVVDSVIFGAISKLIIATVIIVVICAVIVILLARKIKEPLEIISVNLELLSEGHLKAKKTAKSGIKEIYSIIMSRVRLTNALQEIVGKMQDVSEGLLTGGKELAYAAENSSANADDVSHAVEDISKGSVSMASDIDNATLSVSDMGDKIESIVSGISDLDNVAGNMDEAGRKALEIIRMLDESNSKTAEAIRVVAENVEATDRSVAQITTAVDLITEIAEQTNLLSLNASIEAARAGEAGRGFAVVANEISGLAAQSNESAKQIEDILEGLVVDSRRSISKMEEVRILLDEQSENLRNTEKEFENVEAGIHNTRQQSTSVDGQAKQCDESRVKVIDIISSLSAVSQENAASTQQTTASMEELNATISLVAQQAEDVKKQAETLKDAIDFFKQ